jgi:membrane-associated phospholipid phosphatase
VKTLLRITASLHSADILVIGFGVILSAVSIIFSYRIPSWGTLVVINIVTICLICALGIFRQRTQSRILRAIHNWYVAPIVFFSFKELYFIIKPLHFGKDYDDWLIAIDRWLFGVNPTEWIMQFANPFLTEILQVAYTSFYFLFFILGTEFYRRKTEPGLFHYFMFTAVYGFFLSYLGYFFLPAVGPRFTLHDFSQLDVELPGIVLTPYLRWFVNAGGSVPMGVPNDAAIAGTQRDVFPSGHTMMTLVLMYMSARFNAKVRVFMYVIGGLLIVATVYQRYHYVIDLFAGAIFMLLCIVTSAPLYRTITLGLGTIEKEFPPVRP